MSSFEQITRFPGSVGFYARYLDEDRVWTHNPDLPLIAASVIKIPIMVTAMRDIAQGNLDPDARVAILPEMKLYIVDADTGVQTALPLEQFATVNVGGEDR